MYYASYVILDLEELDLIARNLRCKAQPSDAVILSSLCRKCGPALFDLSAVVYQIKLRFYSPRPISVVARREYVEAYMPVVKKLGLDFIEVSSEVHEQSLAAVAIAYNVATHALVPYGITTVALGSLSGVYRTVAADLRKAGRQVVGLGLESDVPSVFPHDFFDTVHMISKWAWCQPTYIPASVGGCPTCSCKCWFKTTPLSSQ